MSGKSKEEIAFELVSKLKGVGVWGENNMGQILDMYAECLEATSGLRNKKAAAPQTGAQNPVRQPAPPQFAPQQQPQSAASAQPLHQHAQQAAPYNTLNAPQR
ncbi:hypothetical protein [Litorimonas sp.]|uniref:hypothetical protein n=1 Tax=Litorimonas sp. TaxID=1892381 RepID=UPI003A843B0C